MIITYFTGWGGGKQAEATAEHQDGVRSRDNIRRGGEADSERQREKQERRQQRRGRGKYNKGERFEYHEETF